MQIRSNNAVTFKSFFNAINASAGSGIRYSISSQLYSQIVRQKYQTKTVVEIPLLVCDGRTFFGQYPESDRLGLYQQPLPQD
jgi:hypothetical protein